MSFGYIILTQTVQDKQLQNNELGGSGEFKNSRLVNKKVCQV